jgi:hypothetical protein
MAVAEYSFDAAIKFGGWIVGALSFVYSIYRHHLADKRIRQAEARQEVAEKALRAVESRGKAPYFVPSTELFQNLYEQLDDGGIYFWPAMNGNVLCAHRRRVADNIPQDKPVILVLENHGASARRITLTTSLKNCVLRQEASIASAGARIFLKYQFEPALLGAPCEVKISFESMDGFHNTHTYRTVHGERIFERFDPP